MTYKLFRAVCLIAAICTGSLMAHAAATTGSLDRCPVPYITSIQNVTADQAEISWYASDSVLQVDLEWRAAGSPDWISESQISNPFILSGLSACETYEVRVTGQCAMLTSNPSASWEFVADGCCRIPTGLELITTSQFSATIGWDAVSFAQAHHVRYRTLGKGDWTEIEVTANIAGLQSLASCAPYEVQVGSQCDLDSTEYSSSLIFQTDSCAACSTIQYCPARADDASAEWIDSIAFGSIRLQSGNNQGYLLRNTPNTGLERKRPYQFFVKPGSTIPGEQFYLRMWIDLNRDSVFTDSTELLIDPKDPIGIGGYQQTLIIADSIGLGNTRMRVALKAIVGQDTLRPESCGAFLFGEVEDYCISIDDLCPEVEPFVISATETSVRIGWPPVDPAIVFLYQYRDANGGTFGEVEFADSSMILIDGLEKCHAYILRTLTVCAQDTSSYQEFLFLTECPDATEDIAPLTDQFVAYPNPFNKELSVALIPNVRGKARLRMYDMVGRLVRSTDLTLEVGQQSTTGFDDLDELQHGMYLLVLEADGRTQIIKLVK